MSPNSEHIAALVAIAFANASLGLDVCAKRARDEGVASKARELAARARRHAEDLAGVPPRTRMSDRMRWEWLASTGSLLGAAPLQGVVAECLRVFERAVDTACTCSETLAFADTLIAFLRELDALHISLGMIANEHALAPI